MRQRMHSSAIPLFLMGLFSETQIRIVAFMDITELVCYIAGPILFLQDLPKLKKHGFGTFLLVWFLCAVGCCLSSLYNHTALPFFLRGFGVPVAVFCLACVFHHFLSRDFASFKWFFLGVALSNVLSLFVFQRGTSRMVGGEDLAGEEAFENAVGYSLFWLVQLTTWLSLPIKMRYLKTPKIYVVGYVLFTMVYGLLSAGSRSTFGVSFLVLLLVLNGGKQSKTMDFLKKHFWTIALAGMLALPVIMWGYKTAALSGVLGDVSLKKYQEQSARGSGLMPMLMSGRAGFFIGIDAALDRPIMGFGPWAVDEFGYLQRYTEKYGSADAIKVLNENLALGRLGLIPSHSFVVNFWLWYGIFGLICMLYTGWLYFKTLKDRLSCIPELYGYFALALPTVLWAWLFSPFGHRTSATFLMVLCLFAKAVAEKRFIVEPKI